MRKFLLFCIGLSVWAGSVFAQDTGALKVPKGFGAFCEKVRAAWNLPGYSVVVVKDGEVVFSEGFGTTSVEGGAPVTSQTRFVMASTTKAMTAALLATLVDEGLVAWDDPVIKHLPDFKLYDPWVTENFLVKDIMVHRTGFKNYATDDLPYFGYDRDEIYRILRHIKPTYSFRTTYAYNNAMYTVAARIIEKYTGMSWDDAIVERLFKPLEMHNSTTGNKSFHTAANLSKGHRHFREGDAMKAVLRTDITTGFNWLSAVAPAGFGITTADDMGNWLLMLTGNGMFNGQRFLSEKNRRFLTVPQTVVSADDNELVNYAQGWRIESGRQGKIHHHTGLAFGFTAIVGLVPELNMGVAILTNGGNTTRPQATVMRQLIDWYRGVDSDWFSYYYNGFFTPVTPSPSEQPDRAVLEKPLSDYTGVYFKEDFGDLTIHQKDGQLYFRLKAVDVPMTYKKDDTFTIRVAGAGTLDVTFFRSENGKINEVTFDIGDPIDPFTRK